MAKRTLQSVNAEIAAAIKKLNQPGGATKGNQFRFLFQMAKVGGLDNSAPEVKELKSVWGEQMRARRLSHGLSLRDVGRHTLMSYRTIKDIEEGKAHVGFYPFVALMLEVCIANVEDKAAEKVKAGNAASNPVL